MSHFTEDWTSFNFDKVVELYASVGWVAHAQNKESLYKAYSNSTFVQLAFEGDELVGALRSVSDDVTIHYLQDLLVRPNYQHRGVGRTLIERAMKRFVHVRCHILLTDDEDIQKKFYHSVGYENLKSFKNGALNAFIRMHY